MRLFFDSRREALTLRVVVKVAGPTKITVRVRDWKKPHTVYTDRWQTVSNIGVFKVRMPQSPERCIVDVFNTNNGNLPTGKDNTFKLVDMGIEPLKQRLTAFDYNNGKVQSFIKFLQEFSENAGVITAGHSVYTSDDGKFRIDYLDRIMDHRTGKPMATPARISQDNGRIEVSKEAFIKYSVPMRMAILLHEISHFYLNDKMTDEIEADLNALKIYLGLGYPRIEAQRAFLEVFMGTPTELNKKRYQVLDNFIRNFDNMK